MNLYEQELIELTAFQQRCQRELARKLFPLKDQTVNLIFAGDRTLIVAGLLDNSATLEHVHNSVIHLLDSFSRKMSTYEAQINAETQKRLNASRVLHWVNEAWEDQSTTKITRAKTLIQTHEWTGNSDKLNFISTLNHRKIHFTGYETLSPASFLMAFRQAYTHWMEQVSRDIPTLYEKLGNIRFSEEAITLATAHHETRPAISTLEIKGGI